MLSKLMRKSAIVIATLMAITAITIVAYADENNSKLNNEIIVITVPELKTMVAKSNINVRKTKEMTDTNIVATINRGTSVIINEIGDGWTKISVNGITGYVATDLLLTEEEYKEWNTIPYSEQVPLTTDLQRYLYQECQDTGIKYCFALALIDQETGGTFRADLISRTNDYGLTQINKCNHKKYINMGWITCSNDLLNPYNSIHCGLDFMSQYTNQYGCVERAYASYNTGKAIKSNKNSRSFMKKYEYWKSILGDI